MGEEDRAALEALLKKSSRTGQCWVRHFIYGPDRTNVDVLATKLRSEGYDVEVRKSAAQANWLLLARHRITPNEDMLDRLREHFSALAAAIGGEYDGWEAEAS